jgi:ribosomal protein L11 methylase PrmA
VLSGILDHQAAEVRACYDEWFDMNFEQHEGGWVLLAGRRR